MASFGGLNRKRMVAVMIAAVVAAAVYVPAKASAGKQFIVGDERGWTNNFDYTTWAEGKQFFVGDSLVFNYPPGRHNVFRVNGTDFQGCAKPPAATPLTTGSDEIQLSTPGRKWYICGFSGHCSSGQKLVITVSEGPAAPTSVQISPEYSNSAATTGRGSMMISIGIAALVVVGTLGMLLF